MFGARPTENDAVLRRMILIREDQTYPDLRVHHMVKAASLFYPNWDAGLAAMLLEAYELSAARPVKKHLIDEAAELLERILIIDHGRVVLDAPADDLRGSGTATVVHHGGAGTTTTAARAGAPQVIVPQAGDQSYWAGRVAELGIGAAHDGPVPTTESLPAALRMALAPETRARAAALAGTIRTDGATVAAKLLLDAVTRRP